MKKLRSRNPWGFRVAFWACLTLVACAPSGEPDRRGGDDANQAAAYGHPDSVLFWTPEQQLAGFPNYDRIFETRAIPAGSDPFPLPRRLRDFSGLSYKVEERSYDLEAFLEHNRVAGLLVLKEGSIVLEEYRLGHRPETLWVSYSVAKSVVSLLIGAAIRDGYIKGIGEPVTQYLPVLRGTSYEGVTIGHVLQMASGVEWNEDYTDPAADVSLEIGMTNQERLSFLSSKKRLVDPGVRFNYNTGETHLAGAVLGAAIGNHLATYLGSKIWQPFGMEHDANWRLVEPGGAEHGGCCISATLRDYGRLGMFALRAGTLRNGDQTLPPGWMDASKAPSAGNPGYGYLWWLGDGQSYAARGIFGQGIFIDPSDNVVIVTHSAWPVPTGTEFSAHRDALVAALKQTLNETGADE